MVVPELFSRERSCRWAEHTTFVMLVVLIALVSVGLGWWSVLIVALADAVAFVADVVRHERGGTTTVQDAPSCLPTTSALGRREICALLAGPGIVVFEALTA